MLIYIGETFGDNKSDALKLFRETYKKEIVGLKLSLEKTGNTWSPGKVNNGYKKYDVYCESTRKDLEKTLGHLKGKLPLIVK